ncbi:hypothetical protein [Streptomyces sp. NPDC096132]|uniref:hypothetical protein n=1 Tax=Streptomyces sp. NPDC096132 TaxID=3366075 RepID=UPI0037F6A443
MQNLTNLSTLVLIALVAAIWLWALIDCARTPSDHIRFVPKILWLLFLLHGSVCAALLWTYFGKKSIRDTAKGPVQRTEPLAQAR